MTDKQSYEELTEAIKDAKKIAQQVLAEKDARIKELESDKKALDSMLDDRDRVINNFRKEVSMWKGRATKAEDELDDNFPPSSTSQWRV